MATSLILVWKFLSTDYTGLAPLRNGPDLYPLRPSVLLNPIRFIQNAAFDQPAKIQILQVVTAFLIVVGALRQSRPLLAVGILSLLIFEWNADRYRGPLYDTELPTVLISLLVLWPRPWRNVLGTDRLVSAESTSAGMCIVAYVGASYLLSGISKVTASPVWWAQVRLDLLYPAIVVGHGISLPPAIDYSASLIHGLFARSQPVREIAAFLAEFFELTWPLALFFRPARYLVPLSMLGTHLLIFAASGLLFLPMGLAAYCSVVKWRHLVTVWHKRSKLAPLARWSGIREVAEPDRKTQWPLKPVQVLAPVCAAVTLAWFPLTDLGQWPPFLNYELFGFNYSAYDRPVHLYRLGILMPGSQTPTLLPANYAGFLDYQLVTNPESWIIAYVKATSEAQRQAANAQLQQFERALRPPDSYRWLLGPLAAPPHLAPRSIGQAAPTPGQIVLIEGTREFRDGGTVGEWHIVERPSTTSN